MSLAFPCLNVILALNRKKECPVIAFRSRVTRNKDLSKITGVTRTRGYTARALTASVLASRFLAHLERAALVEADRVHVVERTAVPRRPPAEHRDGRSDCCPRGAVRGGDLRNLEQQAALGGAVTGGMDGVCGLSGLHVRSRRRSRHLWNPLFNFGSLQRQEMPHLQEAGAADVADGKSAF